MQRFTASALRQTFERRTFVLGAIQGGIGLLLGAMMRATLRDHDAGMLRVRRSRWVDVLMLGGVGATLITLASVIPNQPGA